MSSTIRYPSTTARKSLAKRLCLRYEDSMQDWEYEVADALRFHEFLAAYEDDQLTEDERFSMMQVLVQCVEDMGNESNALSAWKGIEQMILQDRALHAPTVEYWACIGESEDEAMFKVSPHMRALLATGFKHGRLG